MQAEWIEDVDTEVSDWLHEAFGATSEVGDGLNAYETLAYEDTEIDVGEADPAVVQATAQLVGQLIPLIAQGMADQGQQTVVQQASDSDNPVLTEEAFGAIIGAIASALPAIIPAVRNLVGAVRRSRRRRGRPRRPATPAAPLAAGASCPTGCMPASTGSPTGRTAGREDESAAAIAALVPVLVQLLPALIPLITDLLIPLLTRTLPALLSRKGRNPRSRRRHRGRPPSEAIINDEPQMERQLT